jgi:N6-L-threonylcarbamoyladenine synthase
VLTLGIETSCDETSAALVDETGILANIVMTQAIHTQYGGVVPEFASRAHIRQLLPIIQMALEKADRKLSDVQGMAVTYGPGLAGSLLVGVSVCKGLALQLNVPWIGVNHIEGHALAVTAEKKDIPFPCVALVASGGHTLLIFIEKLLHYKIIGRTIDDAAGEAFDKVAKTLGLGFPGGPAIEKSAVDGNERAIAFPRALMEKDNLNFSFSGLKTAVLYYVKSSRDINVPDIAASFQHAVIDVLIEKCFRALDKYRCKNLILAGGVIRNSTLRQQFESYCNRQGILLHIPSPILCTDNAGMIAHAGRIRLLQGQRSALDLDVAPNMSLDEIV